MINAHAGRALSMLGRTLATTLWPHWRSEHTGELLPARCPLASRLLNDGRFQYRMRRRWRPVVNRTNRTAYVHCANLSVV